VVLGEAEVVIPLAMEDLDMVDHRPTPDIDRRRTFILRATAQADLDLGSGGNQMNLIFGSPAASNPIILLMADNEQPQISLNLHQGATYTRQGTLVYLTACHINALTLF